MVRCKNQYKMCNSTEEQCRNCTDETVARKSYDGDLKRHAFCAQVYETKCGLGNWFWTSKVAFERRQPEFCTSINALIKVVCLKLWNSREQLMYASQHSLFARMRNISRLFCWKSTGFLPSANEVWGKVMFLHLSVRHSVHGGDLHPGGLHPGCLHSGGGLHLGALGGSASGGGWADPPDTMGYSQWGGGGSGSPLFRRTLISLF